MAPSEVYEIEDDSVVEVEVVNGKFYRGEFELLLDKSTATAKRNPLLDKVRICNAIELPSGKKMNGTVEILTKDVKHIQVKELGIFRSSRENDFTNEPNPRSGKKSNNTISKAERKKEENKNLEAIEIQLKTFVISTHIQLKVLMNLVKEIDVVGISLEGENVGRYGKVSWIVMAAKKTLLPFDVDVLIEQVPDLWEILNRKIFGNEKITKIIHDCRSASDYLTHVHGINLVQVFDTQVADAYVEEDRTGAKPDTFRPLSDCLTTYNRRIPPEEIDFLRRFEGKDFSYNSPWLRKPLPPREILKLAALKVKHLVPLRENLMNKILAKYTSKVEEHLDCYRHLPDREYKSKRASTPSSSAFYSGESLYTNGSTNSSPRQPRAGQDSREASIASASPLVEDSEELYI